MRRTEEGLPARRSEGPRQGSHLRSGVLGRRLKERKAHSHCSHLPGAFTLFKSLSHKSLFNFHHGLAKGVILGSIVQPGKVRLCIPFPATTRRGGGAEGVRSVPSAEIIRAAGSGHYYAKLARRLGPSLAQTHLSLRCSRGSELAASYSGWVETGPQPLISAISAPSQLAPPSQTSLGLKNKRQNTKTTASFAPRPPSPSYININLDE